MQDDDPQTPNRIGGSIQLPPLQVTNVAFSKSATALPTPPLGQTAPGPIYPGLPRAGISPVAPGHTTMTGIPQRPIGLDKPQDTRAAAMPGMPGHAATNVIDQQGALDPRGMTVDGNNSASVIKFPKLASSVAQVADRDFEAAKAVDIRRAKAALAARQTALAVSPGWVAWQSRFARTAGHPRPGTLCGGYWDGRTPLPEE